jgi:hypothetical protein
LGRVGSENKHIGIGELGLDFDAGLDSRAIRELHSQDYDIGPAIQRYINGFLHRPGLADDFYAWPLAEQRAKTVPEDDLAVHHQDADA